MIFRTFTKSKIFRISKDLNSWEEGVQRSLNEMRYTWPFFVVLEYSELNLCHIYGGQEGPLRKIFQNQEINFRFVS